MRQIVDLSEDVAEAFATEEKRPEYVAVKVGAAAGGYGHAATWASCRTTARTTRALSIEDVDDGRPAAKAGLKAGDNIIEIAGKPVKNITTYMEVMGAEEGRDHRSDHPARRQEADVEGEAGVSALRLAAFPCRNAASRNRGTYFGSFGSTAEKPAHETVFAQRRLLSRGRRGGGPWADCADGAVGGAAAIGGVLQFGLQHIHFALHRAVLFQAFEFVANFTLKALQIVALAGHLGTFFGHADFHLAHLLHQALFILLELTAFAFEFFAEREQFLLARGDGNAPLLCLGSLARFNGQGGLRFNILQGRLCFLQLLMQGANDLGLFFQHTLVFAQALLHLFTVALLARFMERLFQIVTQPAQIVILRAQPIVLLELVQHEFLPGFGAFAGVHYPDLREIHFTRRTGSAISIAVRSTTLCLRGREGSGHVRCLPLSPNRV